MRSKHSSVVASESETKRIKIAEGDVEPVEYEVKLGDEIYSRQRCRFQKGRGGNASARIWIVGCGGPRPPQST